MKLELQQELLRRYSRTFRLAGERLALAGKPEALPVSIIEPGVGVHSFNWFGEAPQEDYRHDDLNVFDTWGFECGDGWFDLIDQFSRVAEDYIEQLIADGMMDRSAWPRVAQLKEKFGLLTIYVHVTGDMPAEIAAAIKRAREASQTTCESCGKPGAIRQGGWIHVYCDACEAEYQREQANPTERGWGDIDERIAKLKAMLDARSP